MEELFFSPACSGFQLPPRSENRRFCVAGVLPDLAAERTPGRAKKAAGTGRAVLLRPRTSVPVLPEGHGACCSLLAGRAGAPASGHVQREPPGRDPAASQPAQADGFCRALRMLERGYFGPRGRLNSRRIPALKNACQGPRRWERCGSSVLAAPPLPRRGRAGSTARSPCTGPTHRWALRKHSACFHPSPPAPGHPDVPTGSQPHGTAASSRSAHGKPCVVLVGEGGSSCLDPPLRTHVGHQAPSSVHLPSGREWARSHRPLPSPRSVGPNLSATMPRTAGRTQPRGDGRGQREGGFLPFSQLPPRVFALRPGSLLPGHSRATAAAVCKEPWDSPDRSRPVPGCAGQPCAPAPSCVPPSPVPCWVPRRGGGSSQGHAAGVCVPPTPRPFPGWGVRTQHVPESRGQDEPLRRVPAMWETAGVKN